MRLRQVQIVNNFSVLMPETQVLGLELIQKDHMPDLETAKMMEPLFNALFSNKHVYVVSDELWMKMQGLTYFGNVTETDYGNVDKHLKSMNRIVNTKAEGMVKRKRQSTRKTRPVVPKGSRAESDWAMNSESDEEGWTKRSIELREEGYESGGTLGTDSEDDSEFEDESDPNYFVAQNKDGHSGLLGGDYNEDEVLSRYFEAGENFDKNGEAYSRPNLDLENIANWITVEDANGHVVLMESLETAPEHRLVTLNDPGVYGPAIMEWLMTNIFISYCYHGRGVLQDHWYNKGLTVQTLSDLFAAPIKYWAENYETIAYVLPEMSKQFDVLDKFIKSRGNEYPILSTMGPTEILGMISTVGAKYDTETGEELKNALNFLRGSDKFDTDKLQSVLDIAAASRPSLDVPARTLRYTKMWLHFNGHNFSRSCANIAYAVMPVEIVYSLGYFIKINAEFGKDAALAFLYEVIPKEICNSYLVDSVRTVVGPIASEFANYALNLSRATHQATIKGWSEHAIFSESLEVAKRLFTLKYHAMTPEVKEHAQRVTEALMIYIPSVFSFFKSTATIGYAVYKFCKKTPGHVGHNVKFKRTPGQHVGRAVLNGLDFFNTVLTLSYSTLELMAMAGVSNGDYGLDEIKGLSSPYVFTSTVILQWYVNARIRDRNNIPHSSFSEIPLYYEKLIMMRYGIDTYVASKVLPHPAKMVTLTMEKAFDVSKFVMMRGMNGSTMVNIITTMGTRNFKKIKDRVEDLVVKYTGHQESGSWVGSHELLNTAKRIHTFDNLIQVHTDMHL
jgi:hypothetical protein